MITNRSPLTPNDFASLEKEVAEHKTLGDVLAWANTQPKQALISQIVAEVITQDEFTHDIIIPYRDLSLVYDTT